MRNPLLSVLKRPSFLFLIISEFFSQFAMNLLNFILLIVVFKISSSNLAVAGVILAFTLPSIFFGIVAGVLVDRWNKKRVLVVTNMLRAIVVIPLFFVSTELFLMYIIIFIISLVTQFFVPAEAPIIPQLVPRKLLLPANALFSVGIYGSSIVAYSLSGPLLLVFDTTKIFLFISILFLVSSVFALMIRFVFSNENKISVNKIQFIDEIKGSFSLILKKEKIFHSIFILTLLQTLLFVIAVIGPGYATNIVNIQIEKFPLFFVMPAVIGMVIGAIMIGNFLNNVSKRTLVKYGVLIIGVILILFPKVSFFTSREIIQNINNMLGYGMNIENVHIMMIMGLIVGFGFSLVFVPSNTMIQEETSDMQRGKIYGALNSFIGIISIIPILSAGVLADLYGIELVLTSLGIVIIFFALFLFWKYKYK